MRTAVAALALWDYSEQSARYIFGDATGGPVADQILNALRAAGKNGMTRTEISNLFGRNMSSERIAQALKLLLAAGRVRRKTQKTGGGRRRGGMRREDLRIKRKIREKSRRFRT